MGQVVLNTLVLAPFEPVLGLLEMSAVGSELNIAAMRQTLRPMPYATPQAAAVGGAMEWGFNLMANLGLGVAGVADAGALGAGRGAVGVPTAAAPKPLANITRWTMGRRFEIAVDTSTLLDMAPEWMGGRGTHTLAQFDAALAGRYPIIPEQTFREFVVNTPLQFEPEVRQLFLQELMQTRAGALRGTVLDARPTALALRVDAELTRTSLTTGNIPKRLGLGDSLVAASAQDQDLTLLLSDEQFIRTLRETGLGPPLQLFQ